MKTAVALFVLVFIPATSVVAQLKSQEVKQGISDGLIQQNVGPSLFGWFNPEKFHMHHSLSLSYQTLDREGVSIGTYTNSMQYDVADNLRARADISLSYSPYNSFSRFGKNDLSSLYLSRAQLDYKPWDNFQVRIQYRNVPFGYYSHFYNPWYRDDGF